MKRMTYLLINDGIILSLGDNTPCHGMLYMVTGLCYNPKSRCYGAEYLKQPL